MGEVCKGTRRRSVPGCLTSHSAEVGGGRVRVDWSTTPKKTSKKKTRWSLGSVGVPDVLRVTRCDDVDVVTASCRRLEEGRKRSCTVDRSPDLPGVPSKRRTPAVDGAASSPWSCVGLTWSGLRRRLGVFRRSCRLAPQRPGRQPDAAVNAGISTSQLFSDNCPIGIANLLQR